jgi:hypothetical protein
MSGHCGHKKRFKNIFLPYIFLPLLLFERATSLCYANAMTRNKIKTKTKCMAYAG